MVVRAYLFDTHKSCFNLAQENKHPQTVQTLFDWFSLFISSSDLPCFAIDEVLQTKYTSNYLPCRETKSWLTGSLILYRFNQDDAIPHMLPHSFTRKCSQEDSSVGGNIVKHIRQERKVIQRLPRIGGNVKPFMLSYDFNITTYTR